MIWSKPDEKFTEHKKKKKTSLNKKTQTHKKITKTNNRESQNMLQINPKAKT